MMTISTKLSIGIAWCLAWGDRPTPLFDLSELQTIKQTLKEGKSIPAAIQPFLEQAQKIDNLKFPDTAEKLRQTFEALQRENPQAWNTPIGLVYGGATKIKGYVFEAAKLQDIRGASALLDRINLIDLPAFFGKPPESPRYTAHCEEVKQWLDNCFPGDADNLKLSDALIPELIIYSTGGNILAFCPAAYIDDLANAIERRYTEQTLTANSCAVGDSFKLLEVRFGLLRDPIEQTLWLDWYEKNRNNHEKNRNNDLVKAYFGSLEGEENWGELFNNRKSFNELAGKLAAQFNHRRSGNDLPGSERPSRCYPPIFDTHPYLKRDEGDCRSAIFHATELPNEPWFSEALARKRIIGQISKEEQEREWYERTKLEWQPGEVESWVNKFERFLLKLERWRKYYAGFSNSGIQQARSLTEIGNASNGFVAYIYADGNNMGGYIQKIKTPADYAQFSEDIFDATENSVYEALTHLKPHRLSGLTGKEHQHRNGVVIHPFEILTIGGDDVLLIVPADKALAIAQTIGEEFEKRLTDLGKRYEIPASQRDDAKSIACHRYQPPPQNPSECQLSMSIGVLITAYTTPIYYAQKLTEQLLKSAKARAKELKKHYHYYGGTVDFLVMKSVTMISSNISSFRREGLTKSIKDNQKLKLHAAPYTLHELGGLLETAKAIKQSGFPRSQLYQIRSLLERGKNTAILNYRYFRVRLGSKEQQLLKENFEDAWCQAATNDGYLAPWLFEKAGIFRKVVLMFSLKLLPTSQVQLQSVILNLLKKSTYETIWRELVDLYPFIEVSQTLDAKIQDTDRLNVGAKHSGDNLST
ncbi:type III-B CRISPR-associated protein Cas10/Cmr2 [Aerosakkonema funiforme]|uniref:type III-B CRISPR-associated protein Cas10/Cmr2 n=1 Tax=Aerosakkonema funiforme TaxID=1246630 RepID=UPI0035BB4980